MNQKGAYFIGFSGEKRGLAEDFPGCIFRASLEPIARNETPIGLTGGNHVEKNRKIPG
jgi:hypothetical protein